MDAVFIAQNRVEATALTVIVLNTALVLELTRRLPVAKDAFRPLVDRRATRLVTQRATAFVRDRDLCLTQIFNLVLHRLILTPKATVLEHIIVVQTLLSGRMGRSFLAFIVRSM